MQPTFNGTYQQLMATSTKAIKALYTQREANSIARLLIMHITQLSHACLIVANNIQLNEQQYTFWQNALLQLQQHYPIQYITETASFLGFSLKVSPHVLIPRPETEELVALIVKNTQAKNTQQPLKILDIGTGSGCIAIGLQLLLEKAQVHAIDVSEKALKIAYYNAKALSADINFQQLNILQQQDWSNIKPCMFDIIVSNPPYIAQHERKYLAKNVVQYEPHLALFVQHNDPLLFYKTIINFAKAGYLKKNGQLYFELSELYASDLLQYVTQQGIKGRIYKDLQAKVRMMELSLS